MARKNKNARTPRVSIPTGTHLMYSTDELYCDPEVVRYMGEQDGESLKCWHPEGFVVWCHITHVWRSARKTVTA